MQIFIRGYITNLSQKQICNIIVKYGNTKAMTLYYSFCKIGLGDSDCEICKFLEDCEKNNIDREIVKLIFKDCIQFIMIGVIMIICSKYLIVLKHSIHNI